MGNMTIQSISAFIGLSHYEGSQDGHNVSEPSKREALGQVGFTYHRVTVL